MAHSRLGASFLNFFAAASLLGCLASPGALPTKTDSYLYSDNIRVTGFLNSLTDSSVGRKLDGVTLQDGTAMLKDAVFLGWLVFPEKMQHIYTFRAEGKEFSYCWIDRKGTPLSIPESPRNSTNQYAFTLSGDNYSHSEVQPGAGVIVLPGGDRKWLKLLRAQRKLSP